MVQLALFTAIILLLAFTPIGYIKLPTGLSITIIGIPVIIGAITLGPVGGAILGTVFGLSSFAQCFGFDPFGAMLLGINPIGIFITCMVPRVLMGWLTALIFQALKRFDKTKLLSYVITSIAGSILNTVLFMTTLMIFFFNTPEIQKIAQESFNTGNVFVLIIAMAGVNAIAEIIVSGIIGTAISKSIDKFTKKTMVY
ncbi:MAG TPA: ECF transporter S component [Herbinix luporum]|nr:ECF transporter S component [Herbinix luporum]